MSCLWCKYYVKLNEECEKGFEVKINGKSNNVKQVNCFSCAKIIKKNNDKNRKK